MEPNKSNALDFDDTGKVVFDDYYNQPDPRAYFEHLGRLGYRIAGEAQPIIERTISALCEMRDLPTVKVVDVGSSYGINAALLKGDISLDELSDRYRSPVVEGMTPEEVLARDRTYYDEHLTDDSRTVIGLDVSEEAISFAVEAGVLDGGIVADLEENRLDSESAGLIRGAELVMSTGAVGYVSEKTFSQVLDATGESRPWVANCVIRMFPYDGFEELLAERGYITEKLPLTLTQRRFASREEQENTLENLEKMGLDPTGLEAEGTYQAEFFLSRPADEARVPFEVR